MFATLSVLVVGIMIGLVCGSIVGGVYVAFHAMKTQMFLDKIVLKWRELVDRYHPTPRRQRNKKKRLRVLGYIGIFCLSSILNGCATQTRMTAGEKLYIGASVADAASTYILLRKGGYEEMNPLYSDEAVTATLQIIATSFIVREIVGSLIRIAPIEKRGPKWLWLGGIRAAPVLWNAKILLED